MGTIKFKTQEELETHMFNAHETAKLFPDVGQSHVDLGIGLTKMEASLLKDVVDKIFNSLDHVRCRVKPDGFKYKLVMFVCLTPDDIDQLALEQEIKDEADSLARRIGISNLPHNPVIDDQYFKFTTLDGSKLSPSSDPFFNSPLTEEEIEDLWQEYMDNVHQREEDMYLEAEEEEEDDDDF